AKSRWCVHGFADPDTENLVTYSPTPQSEAMMLFGLVLLGHGMDQSIVDCKNAFSQSRRLRRAGGPIYVAPCEGLTGIHVPDGCLIELHVAVYGLDDAPWEWHATITSYLRDLGFKKLLMEPCYWTLREQGAQKGQVLIEVDDLWLGTVASHTKWLADSLKARFTFGKWRGDEAEFAGRRIRKEAHRIRLDQEKYILEEIHPIVLEKGRRSKRHESLSRSEFEQLRSGIYRINWAAKETRPEVAGTASILASKLEQMLRDTASQYLTIWRRDLSQVVSFTLSDAAGIGTDSPMQCAWAVGVADPQLAAGLTSK
ncbi:unnamed protein product, partial [Prorocentrum cordatum]